MGLFEEAGRQFERFKQDARAAAEETTGGDDEDPAEECAQCETRVDPDADRCPECESGDIRPADRQDGAQSSSEG